MLNTLTPNDLGKLVAALDTGDIDSTEVATIAQVAAAGYTRIGDDQMRFRTDSASAVAEARLRWADGTGSLGEVVNIASLNAASEAGRIELEKLCRAARGDVESRATRAVRALGPSLFAAMQARDGDLVDTITAQVGTLHGIEGAEQAMVSTPAIRKSWGAAHDAVTERTALAKAAGLLRACRAIPGGEHRATDHIDGRYFALRHPFAWPEGMRWPAHPVLRTLAEIEAGCSPWLASIDEAKAAQAADIAAGDVVIFDPFAVRDPDRVG
jgi:hypothetical protein